MLKEVFRTETIKYRKEGDVPKGSFPWPDWPPNNPYVETLQIYGIYGMVCTPNPQDGDASILMHGVSKYKYWGWADFLGWRYHSVTGKLIKAWDLFSSEHKTPANFLSMTYTTTARSGKYWGSGWSNGWMQRYHYGNIATILPGDDPIKNEDPFWILDGEIVNYTHWKLVNGQPFLPSTTFALDDLVPDGGRFLTATGDALVYRLIVFNLKTGKELYSIPMATQIVNIALADENHAYVLLQNRLIVLVDYIRAEVLGAAKLPPLVMGSPYGGHSGLDVIFDSVRMAWDRSRSRLLVCELTPDAKDYSCTICVRGFRMVPEPVRLTTPMPLKVPRRGRTIPVLVQAVDDMNQGVGGYVVQAKVTGAGSLAGIPISDNKGNTFIQVACNGGSDYGSAV
jgi:hypothetical protein